MFRFEAEVGFQAGVNMIALTWAPQTGSANYATNGDTVTPHNGILAAGTAAVVTPHKIAWARKQLVEAT
jgi:hypothetical protein